jgi:hypothetical protein
MMFGETFGHNMSKQYDEDSRIYQVELLNFKQDKSGIMKRYFEEVSSIGLIKVDEAIDQSLVSHSNG